jgi:membrane associated rhomboid family serine protease
MLNCVWWRYSLRRQERHVLTWYVTLFYVACLVSGKYAVTELTEAQDYKPESLGFYSQRDFEIFQWRSFPGTTMAVK